MTKRLYYIEDQLAAEFGPLYEAKNDKTAVRAFMDLLGKSISGNANDYVLYFVGTIDHDTGQVTLFDRKMIQRGQSDGK